MEGKVSRKMSYIRNQVKQTSTDVEERRSSNWRRKHWRRNAYVLARSICTRYVILCRFGGEKSSSLALTKSLRPYYIKNQIIVSKSSLGLEGGGELYGSSTFFLAMDSFLSRDHMDWYLVLF